MSETQLHNQEPATALPGAILKRCREYHDITLSEAAETTKIGINYLTALEEDRISEFASLAYLKGFLRIYANHLGLNPEDMLRIYERLYDPPGQTPTPAATDNEPTSYVGFRWSKLLLPAILLLLMFVAAAILNLKSDMALPPKVAAPVPPPVSNPAALPQMPVQPVISSVHPLSTAVPKAEPRPKQAKPVQTEVPESEAPARYVAPETQRSFIAGMRVTKNGSLTVTIDGAAPQHYDLSVGDIVEWKAEKNIALELSNGGGVEIEVNGKPLAPLVSSGAPTYVVIDAEGLKK